MDHDLMFKSIESVLAFLGWAGATTATAFSIGAVADLVLTRMHQKLVISKLEELWVVIESQNLPDLRRLVASHLHKILSDKEGRILSRGAALWTSALSILMTFLSLTAGWYLRGVSSSFASATSENFTEIDVPLSIAVNLPFDLATVWVSSWCFKKMSESTFLGSIKLLLIDLIAASLLAIGCVYVCDYLVRHWLNASTYGAPVTTFSVLSGFRDGFLAATDPLNCSADAMGYLTIFYSLTLFVPTFIGQLILLFSSIAHSTAVIHKKIGSYLLQAATEGSNNAFKAFRLTFASLAIYFSILFAIWQLGTVPFASRASSQGAEKINSLFDCISRTMGNDFEWALLTLVTPTGIETHVLDPGKLGFNVSLNRVETDRPDKVGIALDILGPNLDGGPIDRISVEIARFRHARPAVGHLGIRPYCFNADVIFDSRQAFVFSVVLANDGKAKCKRV